MAASAEIVINEIDSDTPGSDKAEFVELKGNPGESANGLVLVFYSVNDLGNSHLTVDLAGLTCDANGYILLADSAVLGGGDKPMANSFIKNTEGAVALYQDVATKFPNGSSPTSTNLKDVIVYKAIDATPPTPNSGDWSGFGLGTLPVYQEGTNGTTSAAQWSISRVPDGANNWLQSQITPKAANYAEQLITITDTFIPPRYNQATAVADTPLTVTLKNVGPGFVNVNRFELATTSSAQFSVVSPTTPTVPTSLAYNETVVIVLRLQDLNPTSNRPYNAVVNYATDMVTSSSGSYVVSSELVRATATAPVGAVVVNELCYQPSSTSDHNHDGDTSNQNDEFVELYNTTNSPILIEGWEQRCTDGLSGPKFHSYVFPAGATIPAKGYVTVFTAGTPTGFVPGTTFTYGIPRIANGGSKVEVNDATKLIDAVAYGNAEDVSDVDGYKNTGLTVTAGGSIGRRPDGSATFRTFAIADPIVTDRPTPNTTNNDLANVSDWAIY